MLAGSWLTASNCGKGEKSLVTTAAKGSGGGRICSGCLSVLGSVLSVFGACNGGGARFRPGFRAWLGAVRPAAPARRLPFLPVVLWKGCPCCPVGIPGSVPHLLRLSFGVGARLGVWLWGRCLVLVSGCRCVAVAVALSAGAVGCGCGSVAAV